MRRLVTAILRAFGVAEIMEAQTADWGSDMLRDLRPDVVIADWSLPRMSGRDFVTRVRRAPDSPNAFVPIVMLTGHAEAEHVRQARDAGTVAMAPVMARNDGRRRTAATTSRARPLPASWRMLPA